MRAIRSMIVSFVLAAAPSLPAGAEPPAPASFPDSCDVVWTSPGKDPSGSMPIGNGDIGANVWVEEGGDIVFYLSKTDAWDENSRLVKLGRIRVSLSGAPLAGKPFEQRLVLRDGMILVAAGEGDRAAKAALWVDANLPVVRIFLRTPEPAEMTVKLEVWRTVERPLAGQELTAAYNMAGGDTADIPRKPAVTPDTVLEEPADRIVWYHRNEWSVWPIGLRLQGLEGLIGKLEDPLLHHTFGGAILGAGERKLEKVDRLTLRGEPGRDHAFAVTLLAERTETAGEWLEELRQGIEDLRAGALGEAWASHVMWWRAFWDRSRIVVTKAPLETGMVSRNALPLRIGADSNGGSRFKGWIERARVWRRALGPEEIARLAADPATRIADGLAGDWDLAALRDGAVPGGAGPDLIAKVAGKVETAEHGGRRCARLDGGGYLEVPHSAAVDIDGALTLDAWIAPGEIGPEGGRIIDKSAVGTSKGYLLDTYPGRSLRLITEEGMLRHDAKLEAGRWRHVAATVDPASGRRVLYLDGRPVAASGPEAGEDRAATITRAYALQRWITACGGRSRGPYAIKFNGSIFTVEPRYVSGEPFDPDWRAWGGDYWWQNTRLPYWPLLASGDHDLMRPLFEMYFGQLELARERTRVWTGAQGSWIGETVSFWGMYANPNYGWNREGKAVGRMDNTYIRHIWQVGLELSMMMLDFFDHTGDETFLKERVVPLASDLLLHFDTRFPRDEAGKILIRPGQACETWQDATNPLPEVAGLHVVIGRLLALHPGLVDPALAARWREMRGRLPEIPLGSEGGKRFVLPAKTFGALGNIENPELYAVFPYRLYGAGKPDLDVGLATWERRRIREFHGWQQNAIQAALLGLGEEAGRMLAANAARKNENMRFPAFWGPNYDWVPDQCHGGNLMSALQSMLLQHDGRRILLLPAWPKGWEAEFKLHAPLRTVVEGSVRDGKLVGLKVTPPERAADIVEVKR